MSGPGADARGRVTVEAEVERKDTSLPRFIVVPSASLKGWGLTATSIVLVEINEISIGRRSLKHWGERDAWFFDLPERQSRELGVDRGDVVRVSFALADQSPPAEVLELLASHPSLRRRWDALSPSRQRVISEHVRSGKREETRRRRARAALGGESGPEPVA